MTGTIGPTQGPLSPNTEPFGGKPSEKSRQTSGPTATPPRQRGLHRSVGIAMQADLVEGTVRRLAQEASRAAERGDALTARRAWRMARLAHHQTSRDAEGGEPSRRPGPRRARPFSLRQAVQAKIHATVDSIAGWVRGVEASVRRADRLDQDHRQTRHRNARDRAHHV